MWITVICPDCRMRYAVRPDVQGRSMRCPNPACLKVFTVQDDKEPPPHGGVNDGPEPGKDGPGLVDP